MVAIIGHNIVGSYKGRHISSRFLGQVGIDAPVVAFASRATYGFVDILWSAVVGGYGQVDVK